MINVLRLKYVHLMLFVISSIAFSFSVFAQFVLGHEPCQLCLFTRFMFVGVSVFSLLSLITNLSFLRKILFLNILGMACFGFYHLGVENHWWAGPQSCVSELPSLENIGRDVIQNGRPHCDKVNWEILGFSSTLLSFLMAAFMLWMISMSYVLNIFKKRLENDYE